MKSSAEPAVSLTKQIVINLVVLVVLFVALESVSRIGLWLIKGDVAYLKFGFVYPATSFRNVGGVYYRDMGGYLAFQPMLHPSVSWAKGDVYINRHGFRGQDFEVAKPANKYRIVTLGESSTFGFHVSDKQTWPYVLNENLKNVAIDGRKVEVINLGLPWYNTQNNLNLANFAVKLHPDLVIFYGGANDIVDIGLPRLRLEGSWIGRFVANIEKYSLFVYKAHTLILRTFAPPERSKEERVVDLNFDRQLIENSAEPIFVRPFEENILRLARKVRESRAQFLLVSQIRAPVGWDWLEAQKREKGVLPDALSKIEELMSTTNFFSFERYVSEKMAADGQLNVLEAVQYFHSRMVLDLDRFAQENVIEYVDFVKALDGDFTCLVSDLHLTPDGNRKLADVLSRWIQARDQQVRH